MAATTPLHTFKVLSDEGFAPAAQSQGAAAYDLYTPVDGIIEPGSIIAIPLKIAVEMQPGRYAQLLPRSSLVRDHKVSVLGGVIDPDYTGEIVLMLINYNFKESFVFKRGDRLAQLCFIKIDMPTVTAPAAIVRDDRGFGSTGGYHEESSQKRKNPDNNNSNKNNDSNNDGDNNDDTLASPKRKNNIIVKEDDKINIIPN
jgi:dUTP pyrophosphatase